MSSSRIIPERHLSESEWLERESQHESRTRPWVEPRLRRNSRGEKHPVEDFLFNYYPFRPSLLRRWSPGFGVVLEGMTAEKFLQRTSYSRHAGGAVWLNPEDLPESRLDGLHWAIQILRLTHQREPQFGCFGLHEWAMVYRAEKGRHDQVSLRLDPSKLADFVESQPICCSHYDAFRFFTPPARPLNRLQPEKGRQPEFEQRGCLHTNMDLYKWAYKFSPWIPSELLADTFALAREIRIIDMRASPYDLRAQGYDPIPIETPSGRAEYDHHQRLFAQSSQPLRLRLLSHLDLLLATHRQPLSNPPLQLKT